MTVLIQWTITYHGWECCAPLKRLKPVVLSSCVSSNERVHELLIACISFTFSSCLHVYVTYAHPFCLVPYSYSERKLRHTGALLNVSNQYLDLKIQQGTQTLTTCLMQWAALWVCSIVEKHLYSVLWRESSVQDEIQLLQIITIIWTFVSKEREIYHLRIWQVLTVCQM